jgi:hypothetical protein
MEPSNNVDIFGFWREYRKIASADSLPSRNENNRICRFCGRREGLVSFRNKSHAVSELLGKNEFLIFDECDTCNAVFSQWERHLSHFFLPYLATLGIRGKKVIPAFYSRKEKIGGEDRTTMKKDRNGNLNVKLSSTDDIRINSDKKIVAVRYRQPPIPRFLVFKALVKIALSLMPQEEISSNRGLFEWLRNHENSLIPSIPGAYITVLKKIMWAKPVAELFKSTKVNFLNDVDQFPKYSLVLRFANLVVQIFLPFPNVKPQTTGEKPNLSLHYFPAFILDHAYDPEIRAIADPTTEIEVTFSVSFEDLSKVTPEERDEVIKFKYQSAE